MNTETKLLRIGTQQYSPYIYYQFQTVFSPQIIILYCMSHLKIYTLSEIYFTCQGRSLRWRLNIHLVSKTPSPCSWTFTLFLIISFTSFLNIHHHFWTSLIISGYSLLFLNIPDRFWMFPIISECSWSFAKSLKMCYYNLFSVL